MDSGRWDEIKKSLQPTIKEWKFILSRIKKSPLSLVGVALIIFYILIAILAPVLAPPKPGADPFMVPRDWLLLKRPILERTAPIPPTTNHIFGTTEGQYDLYYGCIWGTITAFRTGVYVTFFVLLVGLVLGVVAAYYGGIIDEILMRFTDIIIAFPGLILAMALVVAIPNVFNLNLSLLISIVLAFLAALIFLSRRLKITTKIISEAILIIAICVLLFVYKIEWMMTINNLDKVLIALILVGWPGYTRVIRGEVLRVKNEDYVEAARAIGCSDFRIITRHILPNSVYPIIIMASLDIGSIVLSAAALSFLGLGAPEGYADWGWLINISRGWIGQAGLFTYLHAFLIPGMFIFTFVLGWNLLGDAFRDILDPTLRRR